MAGAWGKSWGTSWGATWGYGPSAWGRSWGASWGWSWDFASKPKVSKKKPSYVVPNPDVVSFDDWACRVTELFAHLGVASPPSEAGWRDWVCSMFNFGELVSMNIPSPDGFSDWRAWARQFIESVR